MTHPFAEASARTAGRSGDREPGRRRLWWGVLLALILLALVLRLVAGVEGMDSPLRSGLTQMWDGRYYDQRAAEILAGDWLGQEVFYLAPLYPYVLALLYALAGGVSGEEALPAVIGFQALIGAASCGLIGDIGRRLAGSTAGLLACAAAAVYEPFIYQGSLVMPTAVVLFTHVLAVWLVLVARDRRDLRIWGLAGLALGLAALAHGAGLALAGLLAVWVLLDGEPAGLRRRLVTGAVLVAAMSAPILTVTARNWVVGKDLVLVTSNAGKNFYIGHHPSSDGSFRPHRFPVWGAGLGTYFEGESRTPDDPSPSDVSSWLTSLAWKFIQNDPGRAAQLTWRKIELLFNWYEVPINDNQYFARRYSSVLSAPLLTFGVIGPVGLAGLVLAAWDPRRWAPLLAGAASQVIVFAMMFVLGRYRIALVALLIVLAAACVAKLVDLAGRRRLVPLGGLVAAALLAAAFVHQDIPGFHRERGFGQQHLAVAMKKLQQGELSGARRAADKALRSSFTPWKNLAMRRAKARLIMGEVAEARGRVRAAARHYRQGLRQIRRTLGMRDGVQRLHDRLAERLRRVKRLQRAPPP